jgi:hypothetical protein
LAATIAPRPLTIRGSLDAALRPVAQAELDKAYRVCLEAYAKHGAGKALILQVGE